MTRANLGGLVGTDTSLRLRAARMQSRPLLKSTATLARFIAGETVLVAAEQTRDDHQTSPCHYSSDRRLVFNPLVFELTVTELTATGLDSVVSKDGVELCMRASAAPPPRIAGRGTHLRESYGACRDRRGGTRCWQHRS